MRASSIRSFVAVVGLAVGLSTRATSLESAFAAKLIRARDAREIDRLRDRLDRARVARATCKLQMARDFAPIECYEVLDLERAWKVLDETRFRARRRRLDVACTSAALRLKVPETAGPLDHVSVDCVSRVKEARATRRYRRADPDWSGD